MNKMDDFFNRRLSDFNAAEDGWNVPSDQIWQNVEEHLPKPKKRRRKFIFFLLTGLFLFAISYTTGKFLLPEKFNFDKSFVSTDNVVKTELEVPINPTNTPRLTDDNTETINRAKSSGTKENITIAQNKNDTYSNKERTDQSLIASLENGQTNSNSQPIVLKSQTSHPVVDHSRREVVARGVQNIVPTVRTSDDVMNTSMTQATQIIDNFDNILSSNFFKINALQSLPIRFLPSLNKIPFPNVNTPSLAVLNKLVQVNNTNLKKKEVGLSHSISGFTFLKSQEEIEDMNVYKLQIKFKNINFEYGQWISDRWKFSTGIYLSKINVNLDFQQFFNFDQTLMNTSIATEYGNTLEKSSANNAGNLRVTFFDGMEPLEGELINLKGNVDISLSALQVPLFLSHHRRKAKFEHFFGGGITLELLQEKQNNAVLDIFREDQIISSTTEVDDLVATGIDYSIYAITGIRYHLSNKINTGINLKLNFTEPVFSTADIGIYYRW